MKTKRITHLLLTLLVMFVILFANPITTYTGKSQAASQVYLPIIMRSSLVAPADEAASRITVPPGFAIRIFAQGLTTPRLMAAGPDGWVYVATPGAGQIVRLPDRDRNHLADSIEVAASGLTSPHNLEWYNGQMYVAETGRVSRLSDQNGDGFYETRVTITDNVPDYNPSGHYTRTLHFGPDGKLYVSAGSSCNYCEESDPRRAAILRFNPDGTIPSDNPFANDPNVQKRPVWAWGLRNSVDFLWSPSGALWANHNGSDGLGNDIPPEEIIIPVQGNRSHGWPYCYTPVLGLNSPTQSEVRDTRINLPAGFTCSQAVPALYTGPAHSAPLGMTAAQNVQFPSDYKDDIFVAYHGSWNTDSNNFRDCKVERILIQNGNVVGSETFANGWRAPGFSCNSSNSWGRPAGVVVGADGSLYISDDKNGRIFRVTYIGS